MKLCRILCLLLALCFAVTEHSARVSTTLDPPACVPSPSPTQPVSQPPLAKPPPHWTFVHESGFRLRGGGSPAAAGMELASPPKAMSVPQSKRRKRTEFMKAEGGDSAMDYTRFQQDYAQYHKEEMVNNFPSSSESEEEDLAGLSYDDWYRRWMERDEARRIRKNWRHTETDYGQGVLEGRFSKEDIMGWCNYVPLDPAVAANGLSSLPPHQLNRHLLHAAENGIQELVISLVEAGADVNQGNNESFLPASISFGHNDEHHQPMRTSRNCTYGSYNADKKELTAAVYNWTALHWATNSGHSAIVQLLLGMGADVDRGGVAAYEPATRCPDQGMTPLHLAAAKGRKDLVEILLAAGSNASGVDKSGTPPLFYAAGEGHVGVTEALIEAGASVNQINELGWSALFWAAQGNHPTVVHALLEHGADPEIEERAGEFKNALRIAEEKDYEEVCDLLATKMGLEKVTPEELNSIERRELEDQCRARLAELRAQVEKQVTKDAFETVSAEEAARRGPSMEHQIIKEEELLERLQEINRRHVQEAGDPAHGNLW